MLKLDKPAHSALDTFTLCISRVKNVNLKNRLNAATNAVVAASAAYDVAGPLQNLHSIPRVASVVAVTKDEMETVYTQRMAGSKGPGRPVYDEIFASAPNGRCPLCAHRNVMTLDHHLPQSPLPSACCVAFESGAIMYRLQQGKTGGISDYGARGWHSSLLR
ncbi:hypothetical protein ACVI3U_004629 [Sinorhizobium medicae]